MNKFLIKINNFKKGFKEFKKINPHKHWTFLLDTFFFLILILILFSFYLLYQIKNEQVFQVKNEELETQRLINESLLKKTVNQYDIRQETEIKIKSSPSIYNDPSIY